jgi:hypothetical protein
MPTSAADTEIAYAGNGVTQAFAFPFEVRKASHFEATIDGVVTTAYTLSGLGVDTGGTCTFTTPPASLAEVVLARVAPYARTDFDYQEGGELAAATLDDDIDDQSMQTQQIATILKRVPKVKRGDLTTVLDLVPETGTLLGWSGTSLANVDPVTVTPTAIVMSGVGQDLATAASKEAVIAYLGSQAHGVANLAFSCTVAANQLTIAVKGHDGNDLNANSRAFIPFRSATEASGDMDVLEINAALSMTIPNGATIGSLLNNEPFRLWVVAFNDAGTLRLGVIKALNYNVSSLYTGGFPVLKSLSGRTGIASSTQLTGASMSAGIFYTPSVPLTAKPYAVLGSVEYAAGLPATGLWSIVPTGVTMWRPGLPLPGDVVATQRSASSDVQTGTTTIPQDDTIPQNTEGVSMLGVAFTSTSRPNLHRITGSLVMAHSSAVPTQMTAALCEATLPDALAVTMNGRDAAAGSMTQINIDFMWVPTLAAPSYSLRGGCSTAGTVTLNGTGGARLMGGRMVSHLQIDEIMV